MGVSVWLLSFCVGAVLLQEVVSQNSVPIVTRSHKTLVGARAGRNVPDPHSFGCRNVAVGTRITCGSCTSVQICNYQQQEEGSYDCSTVDPSRPFCQNGVCIEESDCTTQSNLCPAKNKFYPVPNNCSEAVYCDNDLAGSIYTAPVPSYMFDFKYDTWVYYQSPSDCFEINCSIATNLNKFFAYKPHPQLYIYCGTSGPLTFQCGDNNVYNEETNACEFGCLKAGKFAIEGVKDKYYSCLAGPNGTLEKFELSCPPGTEFHPNDSQCKMIPPN